MSDPDDTVEDQIRRAEERLHILDGLVRAMGNPHALLDVLLQAGDLERARGSLQSVFGLSEIQAVATLDLQLRQVAPHQWQKVVDDRDAIAAELASLRAASG